MSYDLTMFRRQQGIEAGEAFGLLVEGEEQQNYTAEFRARFLIDKRAMADHLLASELGLEEFDGAEEFGIELNTPEDSEMAMQFLCSDHSIGVMIPYWELTRERKVWLERAWGVMLKLCREHGLILYDTQVEAESDEASLDEVEAVFKSSEKILKSLSEDQPKRPWWKFW